MLRNQQVLQCIDRFLVGALDCVQIALRRGDIAVTEPRLHLPDIDTGVQKQGRRSVAQGVEFPHFQPMLFQELPESCGRRLFVHHRTVPLRENPVFLRRQPSIYAELLAQFRSGSLIPFLCADSQLPVKCQPSIDKDSIDQFRENSRTITATSLQETSAAIRCRTTFSSSSRMSGKHTRNCSALRLRSTMQNRSSHADAYIAVRPADGKNYIRLKSLGSAYSEDVLRNRLEIKAAYEQNLVRMIQAARDTHAPNLRVLEMMRRYTILFSDGHFPVRKKNPKGILSWQNDAELDRLTALNAKINQGATLDSLRQDAEKKQQEVNELTERLEELDSYVRHHEDLVECAQIVFYDKQSAQFTPEEAREMLRKESYLNAGNWRESEQRIEKAKSYRQNLTDILRQAEKELREAGGYLTTAEQVLGGSFLQVLERQEDQRRKAESGAAPNGQTDADAPPERVQFTSRRR